MDVRALSRGQRVIIAAAIGLSVVAAAARLASPKSVTTFLASAAALAALAALVGQSIEQVGEHMGPGATGLLQSALGNLPELFVGIFALRAGLVDVVRAALVGSVLANTLLVLGLAVLAGGWRHGAQHFDSDQPTMIGTLLLLAVAALLVPTLATRLHTPAAAHAKQLSDAVAIILIAVYVLSIPFWLREGAGSDSKSDAKKSAQASGTAQTEGESDAEGPETLWPMPLAIGLLALASLGAALVSDWFVGALEPATRTLGLSTTFTGLVIVAIASNAVENVGGITFAVEGTTRLRPQHNIEQPAPGRALPDPTAGVGFPAGRSGAADAGLSHPRGRRARPWPPWWCW